MPTYEYRCDACGRFAAMAPLAAFALPQPCPVCGAAAPRELVSAPALGGGAVPVRAAGAAPRHAAACGCCAPRRPLRAEAVPGRS
jgi:putative FmdB family regulatory protein